MMKASQKKRIAGIRARGGSAETLVTQRPSSLRPLCAAIIGMMPILSGAQITPDANAERRPSMNQTANGTPLVNIVDPNARGISHNKFQQFNVGPNGVVFNNSMKDGISAIGGQAMKNAGLSNEARAIIGEVTGNGRSSLNGAMEVFGRKADVIIANPNGISVNGVSTVNTNSLTLSTGRVLEQADGSVRLGVDRGNVSIDGAGLSTDGLTHFDIVSRTVQLNGEVNGSADVKVVAGATEFNPETRTHQAVAGATKVSPSTAVSSAPCTAAASNWSPRIAALAYATRAISSANRIFASAPLAISRSARPRATKATSISTVAM